MQQVGLHYMSCPHRHQTNRAVTWEMGLLDEFHSMTWMAIVGETLPFFRLIVPCHLSRLH